MDETLIKPDVMLVTKNVMVPLALPASNDKLFPNPLSSKKKTKIVKTRKHRTIPKSEDINYACRHTNEKSSEKTICCTEYLESNYNSSINFYEENYEYLHSRKINTKEFTLSGNVKQSKNKRQSLLSVSFPMTTEKEEERKKMSLRSLMSNPKNSNVIKKTEDLVLVNYEEHKTEWTQSENEENEVISYKIKRKKIKLPKSSKSFISDPKDYQIEDQKNEEFSLQKSAENKNQCLAEEFREKKIQLGIEDKKSEELLEKSTENETRFPADEIEIIDHKTERKIEDKKTEELSLQEPTENERQLFSDDIEIISNKIKGESSANSIIELHRCISEDISSKLSAAVHNEERKSSTEKCAEIKYSWQDLDNWVPPSEKKKIAEIKKHLDDSIAGDFDCKIKYSWQIIGTGAQTSYELMENFLLNEQIGLENEIEAKNYPCSVKYSWQIIGTATQVSFPNSDKVLAENDEYWEGNILRPRRRSLEYHDKNGVWKAGKCKILYNEGTQTFAEKCHQTDMTNCKAKYSWQNLAESYLANIKLA